MSESLSMEGGVLCILALRDSTKRSIKLISSIGRSSKPCGISIGESICSMSLTEPPSPLIRLLFSKMSSWSWLDLFSLKGDANTFNCSSCWTAPFCTVLDRLRLRGLDCKGSRRVNDFDFCGLLGPEPVTFSILLGDLSNERIASGGT